MKQLMISIKAFPCPLTSQHPMYKKHLQVRAMSLTKFTRTSTDQFETLGNFDTTNSSDIKY